MRLSHTLLAALVLLAPGAARAEKFRYKYRPGQVVRYRAAMAAASLMGQPGGQTMKAAFRVSMKQVQRVRSVSGGVVTLEIKDIPVSGTMTAMGKTQPYAKETTTSIVRLTERGKFLSRKSSGGEDKEAGGSSATDSLDATYGLNFPDRDLKPGESWAEDFRIGKGAQAQKVHVRTRYVGPVIFRGKPCAQFSTALSTKLDAGGGESAPAPGVPSPTGRVTGSITTYFDPIQGLELYSGGSVVISARADLSALSQDAGEFASVMKINLTQTLAAGTGKRQPALSGLRPGTGTKNPE